jgi:hypothetical protein
MVVSLRSKSMREILRSDTEVRAKNRHLDDEIWLIMVGELIYSGSTSSCLVEGAGRVACWTDMVKLVETA